MVMQTEEQHGQSVALRFSEHGQEIGAAHEQQGSSVVHCVEEVDRGDRQPAQDHHQRSEALVHSLEQPVKSQDHKDRHGPGEQVAHDAETEQQLVRGDVIGRCGRVPMHEQGAGNIEEAHGAGDREE